MVDGFKETEAQGVVDFVGAFDDLGCEVFVFHLLFFGTDDTDGAVFVVIEIQAPEFLVRTTLRREGVHFNRVQECDAIRR